MEVEYPQQATSFKYEDFIILMFPANIARTLNHKVILLIQKLHSTVKIFQILVPIKLEACSVSVSTGQ